MIQPDPVEARAASRVLPEERPARVVGPEREALLHPAEAPQRAEAPPRAEALRAASPRPAGHPGEAGRRQPVGVRHRAGRVAPSEALGALAVAQVAARRPGAPV